MWKLPIALAGAIALFGLSAAEASDIAYTTGATVLRRDPSTQARAVANLPRNAELDISHCGDGWCFAHFGDKSGYVAESRLEFEETGGDTVIERTYVEPTYVYPGPYVYGPGFYCCRGGPDRHWHGGPGPWLHR